MDDQSHINGTLPSEPTDKADAGNHGNKELTAEEEKEETGCEKKRTKQPFMYCSLIVRRPKLMFGITLAGHILMVLINLILHFAGYDILPIVFNAFPLELRHSVTYQREIAWQNKDNYPERIRRFVINDTGPTWPRGAVIDYIQLYYQPKKGGNIFTRENLIEIKTIEDNFYKMEEYRTTYCQLDKFNGSSFICTKPRSILRYFDGTYSDIDPVFHDPDFHNIPAVLYKAHTNILLQGDFLFFLSKNSVINAEKAEAEVTRTHIPLGWPVKPPANRDMLDKFLQTSVVNYFNDIRSRSNRVNLNYFSLRLFFTTVQGQAFSDMFLAVGSLVFIFGFIWFQTRSLWVTGWAVLSIFTSFCATNLVYRIILDYRYFGFFHIISIFIILGIGADDIFVFFNTWQASSQHEYPSLAHRLSDCYRRAAGTMFFTSLTTGCAFLASGFSPLLPLGSFGIFTGLMVFINYISVIVYFPTVIITYHLAFEDYTPVCCRPCKGHLCQVDDLTTAKEKKNKKKGLIVRFFEGPFYRFITYKWSQAVVIVVFLGLVGFFGWSASNLDVDSEETRIYRPDTNYGRAWDLGGNAFRPSGDNFAIVNIVFGIRPRDLSKCHFTNHSCDGDQIWDTGFDLNIPPAQVALDAFCHKLKTGLDQNQISDLMIRKDNLTGELEVDCFTINLRKYLKEHEPIVSSILARPVELNYPLTETNIGDMMTAYDPFIYNKSSLPNTFYRYYEIAISSWLTRSFTMFVTDDYFSFNNLIGESLDYPNTRETAPFNPNLTGFYGTRLRYAAIRVNLTLATSGLNYVRGLPIRDKWEQFVTNEVSKLPPQLQGGFQTTDTLWHWLEVQQSLVYNAIFGIVLGLAIAWPVLVLATSNILTGSFAALVICFITLSVMGMIPLIGWKLEVMVSMNLSLIVGLSVDYVVHMAEGYHLAEARDRIGRTRDMLENLGISVLSGAATTIGAAFFMIFADIQFFLQFGSFLMCTIGFSLLFSLLFFTAVISLIGPQNNTGSLKPLVLCVYNKIRGRKGSDVDCGKCQGRGFHENVKSDHELEMKETTDHKLGHIGPYTEQDLQKDEKQK